MTLSRVNEARFDWLNLNNLVIAETTKPGPRPAKVTPSLYSMMPLIKHHCKKRNKHFKKEDKHDLCTLESIDNLIWKNQMQSIHWQNRKQGTGSKKINVETWWTRSQGESAVASVSSALSPSVINGYFKEINTDMAYCAPQPIPILSGLVYSGSLATYCWKVLSKAEAQNL